MMQNLKTVGDLAFDTARAVTVLVMAGSRDTEKAFTSLVSTFKEQVMESPPLLVKQALQPIFTFRTIED